MQVSELLRNLPGVGVSQHLFRPEDREAPGISMFGLDACLCRAEGHAASTFRTMSALHVVLLLFGVADLLILLVIYALWRVVRLLIAELKALRAELAAVRLTVAQALPPPVDDRDGGWGLRGDEPGHDHRLPGFPA